MGKLKIVLIIFIVLSIGLSGFLWYTIDSSKKDALTTERAYEEILSEKEAEIESAQKRIASIETLLTETQTLLQEMNDENEDLNRELKREKKVNDAFEEQISQIGSTVGTLDKLARTDKQLLQKYSKVYFLNEHYMPEKLVPIDKDYLYNESVPKFIHANVEPFFEDMIQDALEAGIKLWVVSAFRSFDEQVNLKGQYTVIYGSGANTFSADQGYSEHQLGTTLDFTTEGLNGGLTGFDTTPAYAWLLKNAHKYGFTLSYPQGNSYYVFEPWHWRFVGRDLAKYLYTNNTYFYGVEQRKIDTYLISLFD